MGSGMDEYWKNKRKPKIKFNDIFTVVQAFNKRGRVIYRLVFNHNREFVNNGMTNLPDDITKLGERWIEKNYEHAESILFEIHVLQTELNKKEELSGSE